MNMLNTYALKRICAFLTFWIYVIVNTEDECRYRKPIVLTATSGQQTLTSPSYQTDSALLCRWIIETENPDAIVQIHILDSDIDSSAGCSRNSMRVYDGPRVIYRVLANICGRRRYRKQIQPTSDVITVVFRTACRTNNKMFKFLYWQETLDKSQGAVDQSYYQTTRVLVAIFGAFIMAVILTITFVMIKLSPNYIRIKRRVFRRPIIFLPKPGYIEPIFTVNDKTFSDISVKEEHVTSNDSLTRKVSISQSGLVEGLKKTLKNKICAENGHTCVVSCISGGSVKDVSKS